MVDGTHSKRWHSKYYDKVGYSLSARNNIVLKPGWPTPGPDYRLIDLDTCDWAMRTPERLRMSSFNCNKPTTHGYTVAINGLHTAKLYAHHSGASRSDYGDADTISSYTLWMYMPVEQGEYLKEIWAIKTSASGTVALMFLTSHERGFIFGGIILHPIIQLQFHCTYATTNGSELLVVRESHSWRTLEVVLSLSSLLRSDFEVFFDKSSIKTLVR
ncbi:hypothetical protein HYQ46_012695 [Verticillium longisporum]|nr:hypothetical protein HYQ44_019666 [Verticillium longisporum]KAG7151517.1 hypothetical protein HYQ46_012695 [Verticillium longisporum]